tara:strand:- start:367 stop:858 length:492 start_codon:yes stop_codon:yes gene_type:complete
MKYKVIKENFERAMEALQEEEGSIKINMPYSEAGKALAEKLLEALREVVPDLNLVKAIEGSFDYDALDLYGDEVYHNGWVDDVLDSFNKSVLSDIPEDDKRGAKWHSTGEWDRPKLSKNKTKASFYIRTNASWNFDNIEALHVRYSSPQKSWGQPAEITIEEI